MSRGEPVPCEILENPRSSNVRLRISKEGILTVVVPRGFRKSRILEILETKREWIRKHRAGLKEASFAAPRPGRIELAAFGENWEIRFARNGGSSGGLDVDEEAHLLLAEGSWQDEETLVRLRKWLVKRCRKRLGSRLEELSVLHGLPYAKMTVKIQKTLWGSCSAKKTVSLNAKLAFLPPSLVDYVLCHELCHTRHLDHSRAFWEYLERILPGSLDLRKALRECDHLVPGWVHSSIDSSRRSPREYLTFYLR